MARGIKIALLIAGVVAGYWIYRSCSQEDDAALRSAIQEMVAQAEARNYSEFM